MNLDQFIIDCEEDWSCYTKKPKCENRAEIHLVSRYAYCQLCKKCFDEDDGMVKDIEGEWKEGINRKLEKNMENVPFQD